MIQPASAAASYPLLSPGVGSSTGTNLFAVSAAPLSAGGEASGATRSGAPTFSAQLQQMLLGAQEDPRGSSANASTGSVMPGYGHHHRRHQVGPDGAPPDGALSASTAQALQSYSATVAIP